MLQCRQIWLYEVGWSYDTHQLTDGRYLLRVGDQNLPFSARDIEAMKEGKRRRSKIHVYPDDWKQLPIAPIPMEQQQEFVKLVDAILAEFERHGYPLPPDAAKRVAELEGEIDERVAGLYGLGARDMIG